jgi:chemotaxis receptor (MCP) glutamine deamidase CheD
MRILCVVISRGGIRLVAEDLQGVHPRKVAFMLRTGQVWVKKSA